MRTSELELISLLARQARLSAARAGELDIQPPAMLVDLVGAKHASDLITREQQILEHDRQAYERQRKSLELSIHEANVEIAAYDDELDYIKQQRQLRQTMVTPLQELAKKGLTTRQRVAESELMLASIERDAQNVIANLSRARQALDRSERDLEMLDIDRLAGLDKELRELDEQIGKARASRSGSLSFVAYVSGLQVERPAVDAGLGATFEVLRKESGGTFKIIAVDEMSPLMPGDVLRVKSRALQ